MNSVNCHAPPCIPLKARMSDSLTLAQCLAQFVLIHLSAMCSSGPWRYIPCTPHFPAHWTQPDCYEWGLLLGPTPSCPDPSLGSLPNHLLPCLEVSVEEDGDASATLQSVCQKLRVLQELQASMVSRECSLVVSLRQRIAELEGRINDLQRQLRMKEARIDCMRVVFRNHPQYASCTALVGRRTPLQRPSGRALGLVPCTPSQLQQSTHAFGPDYLKFADIYYHLKVQACQTPSTEELEEIFIQITMLGPSMVELVTFVRQHKAADLSMLQWEQLFAATFPGFSRSIIDQFPLIIYVLLELA